MLPDAHHTPAETSQSLSLPSIPGHVAGHFCGPVPTVGRRRAVAAGAPVPEAAIQKDNDSLRAKRKVGAADEVSMTPPPGYAGATKQAHED